MAYVGGVSRPGCVFCNALANDDDAASLIVHRGERAFVILNLYPYNTGHLMVVPNEHVDDLTALPPAGRSEMADLTASFCTGLRLVMGCDGLNIGMNLGSAAGAGIADHLHQHIVPRWTGDANFMPIVSGTKVLPELLPATYAKLRAEVARQKSGSRFVKLVVIDRDRSGIYLDGATLPRVNLVEEEPAWKATLKSLSDSATQIELLGWGGPSSTATDDDQAPVLVVSLTPAAGGAEPYALRWIDDARRTLTADEQGILAQARARIA